MTEFRFWTFILAKSENLIDQKEVKFQDQTEQLQELPRRTSTLSTNRGSIVSTGSAALAAAEALCSIGISLTQSRLNCIL